MLIMTNEEPLKKRSDIHILRKVWHMLGVLMMVVVYHNLERTTSIQLMTLVTAVFLTLDLLRQQIPLLNRLLIGVMHPFMRDKERHSIAGTTYLLLGVYPIVLLFPKDIVSLTLILLATADPLASYFGLRYGKDQLFGKKTLQGSLAAFFSSVIISAIFYFSRGLMVDRLLIVSLLSGLIAAVSELLPIGRLDDNLTFPILSSTCLLGVFYIFGGLT